MLLKGLVTVNCRGRLIPNEDCKFLRPKRPTMLTRATFLQTNSQVIVKQAIKVMKIGKPRARNVAGQKCTGLI